MKRKIALMLAAVMTTAMLPVSAMAASSNSVDRIDNVKDDEVIKNVNLKIEPKAAIKYDESNPSGNSIIIDIENGEFDVDHKDKDGNYDCVMPSYVGANGVTYNGIFKELSFNVNSGMADAEKNQAVIDSYVALKNSSSSELPWYIKRISDTQIQVFLAPVPTGAADEAGVISKGKPYYSIPIVAVATSSEEDIKVKIDANGTSISSTTHTVATTSSEDGATVTTVDKIKTGNEYVDLGKITIKESVKGSFKPGKEVKVRVNGGFKIVKEGNIKVSAGVNLKDSGENPSIKKENDNYFTFTIPNSWIPNGKTDLASSITIEGIRVEPDDEDKNWGDVNLTVSGSDAGITKETIKVGERVDYGMEMTVEGEVPTIISGRTYYMNKKDLEEDDFKSAKVVFKETAHDTWIDTRKLQFTLPEGVKIVKVDYDKADRIVDKDDKNKKDKTALIDKTVVTNEGKVLKINSGLTGNYGSKDEGIQFKFELYLSIDADFVGDVTLAAAGAGLAADTIEDVVIAQAVAPISIESAETSVNMGYQVFDAADVTITEAQDGILLDGKEVKISFDDKRFGNGELGFNDSKVEYSIDGELEIKNFEVKEGAITFKVDKTSYTEPSSITISNITVGTTRSVPYGSYDLKVSGEAVINNYDKNVDNKAYDFSYTELENGYRDKNSSEAIRDIDRACFDTTDGYSFDNYVNIVTEAGTLDGVVEVTIGEKTIMMDGEPVDMDVAAYIQTSSNSTMVPLRFVALALGVDQAAVTDADNSSKIAWDANSKTATILYAAGNGQKIIQFQAGSNYMVVDGTSIPMENGVFAEITDSRMFVPFRALGQALGVSVDWDAETRTAIYNKR